MCTPSLSPPKSRVSSCHKKQHRCLPSREHISPELDSPAGASPPRSVKPDARVMARMEQEQRSDEEDEEGAGGGSSPLRTPRAHTPAARAHTPAARAHTPAARAQTAAAEPNRTPGSTGRSLRNTPARKARLERELSLGPLGSRGEIGSVNERSVNERSVSERSVSERRGPNQEVDEKEGESRAAPAEPPQAEQADGHVAAPDGLATSELKLNHFPALFQRGNGADQIKALHGVLSGSNGPLTIDEIAAQLPNDKFDLTRVKLLLEVMRSRKVAKLNLGDDDVHHWQLSLEVE